MSSSPATLIPLVDGRLRVQIDEHAVVGRGHRRAVDDRAAGRRLLVAEHGDRLAADFLDIQFDVERRFIETDGAIEIDGRNLEPCNNFG